VQAAKADIQKDRDAALGGLQAEAQSLATGNHAARAGARRSRTLMLRGTLLRRTMAEAKIPKKTSKKMTSLRSIVRACLLALLAASFAGAIGSLRAQEQPATPQKPQPAEASARQTSLPQQLAHETREAAGEEKDDTAEFKQSPSVQFIARHTGLSTCSSLLAECAAEFCCDRGSDFLGQPQVFAGNVQRPHGGDPEEPCRRRRRPAKKRGAGWRRLNRA
jgi:hypothetical protein